MERTEVIEAVNQSLHNGFEIPIEKLTPTATLFEDLEFDSLDAVDMLVHLEDKLGIKVDADEFREVRKLDDVYVLVHKYANSK